MIRGCGVIRIIISPVSSKDAAPLPGLMIIISQKRARTLVSLHKSLSHTKRKLFSKRDICLLRIVSLATIFFFIL